MKKIIYRISIAAMLFASCDDYLETEAPSKLTGENVYQSLSFTEDAIMGVYASLTEPYVYGQKITTNWPTNSDIETAGLSTDNYNSPTRDAGASNYYGSADNLNQRWDNVFKTVELARTAVEGIRNSPLMNTKDSTLMKAYLGEALTLRALGFFELVKHFGDIPFTLEPSRSDLSNVYIGKTDRDTVYHYIIQDLLEAEQYLPWLGGAVGNKNYSQADRVTKGFVKGLAARVALFAGGWSVRDRNQFPDTQAEVHPSIPEMNGYFTGRTKNWRKYYEIAAQQCAEILGSTDNPHDLDDFENLWKTVNQLQYNKAKENLFEVAFGLGNSGDIGNLIGARLDANTKYGTIQLSGGNVVSNSYYFYSFDKDDKRRDVTLTNISYTADNKEKFNNNPVDWKFAKWRIDWMTDAYKALHKEAKSGRVSTGINWIVMRYSDIYLMFAEAQNELNGSSAINAVAGMSAKDALEKVRTRAFGQGSGKIGAYDSDFFEAVVNERAWEFGGEALRKYDLIRWGQLSDRIEAQKLAMCKMLDGKGEVRIFDKVYRGEDFPEIIYYKFSDSERIDRSSINYYENIGGSPSSDYLETSWLANAARSGTNMKTWVTRILLSATGLNASYDYSSIVAQMDSATSIQSNLNLFKMGNNVCNNRHPFAIYNKNLIDAQNKFKNSYGF
ncbi:RagB/SusD family nutrient uptake outer membrane protein [Dysgonomonas sp. 520]|uniref:RagB/SusD family nutrient uptake outer membrane protein n=1 Tax=Dysgonomonas sp. 520 TaxID=2302931 RepID=UPI0013D7C4F6|nr:RagB/SusD family nutrient uptake outer membrane protein [Dysgonomonas sp. 520]NDW08696.1 RagB/SusD family nutrient uptake outer membrane protein [Dysgonomonas sp. 520]